MKSVKIIAMILSILVLLSCAVACGEEEEEIYGEMDYMTEDLSQYLILGEYKNLTLTAPAITVSDAQVETLLQNLVDKYSSYEEYEEPVTDRLTEAGDYLLIDFAGFMDGEQFERGTGEGAKILLAEDNGYIDWFDDDLYGVMPGTVVETTDFFPENYGDQAVAGKEATFKITVHSIVGHYTVPELTDEFIKEKTGTETLEKYRQMIYDALLQSATEAANMERYQILWEAVMENATVIKLPEEQVQFYYTSNVSYLQSVAESYGYTYESYLEACGATDEDVKKLAEDAVHEELVFYSIVKAENLVIDDEEYAEGVAMLAEAQSMTVEELEEQYGKPYIADSLLWDEMIYTLFDLTTFVSE